MSDEFVQRQSLAARWNCRLNILCSLAFCTHTTPHTAPAQFPDSHRHCSSCGSMKFTCWRFAQLPWMVVRRRRPGCEDSTAACDQQGAGGHHVLQSQGLRKIQTHPGEIKHPVRDHSCPRLPMCGFWLIGCRGQFIALQSAVVNGSRFGLSGPARRLPQLVGSIKWRSGKSEVCPCGSPAARGGIAARITRLEVEKLLDWNFLMSGCLVCGR